MALYHSRPDATIRLVAQGLGVNRRRLRTKNLAWRLQRSRQRYFPGGGALATASSSSPTTRHATALVDVAAQARETFGEEGAAFLAGRPLPDHDWRFEIRYETRTGGAGQITMSRGATAGQVAALIERGPPRGADQVADCAACPGGCHAAQRYDHGDSKEMRIVNSEKVTGLTWRKSKSCASGSCIEVAIDNDTTGPRVLIRDSKLGDDSPHIPVSMAEFRRFVEAAKNGQLGLTA